MSYAVYLFINYFAKSLVMVELQKIVEMNSSNILSQEIKVRFDSTIEKNSIVTFEPEIKTMK